VGCLPHTEEALKHHPLGFIPTLVHLRPSSGDDNAAAPTSPFQVYESAAIARYLDAVVFPGSAAAHEGRPKPALRPAAHDPHTDARVNTIASIAADHLFRRLEFGVVKPRLSLESGGGGDRDALEAEIRAKVKPGMEELEPVLALLESMLTDSASGQYFVGDDVTWADLFAYPPLADLRAMPEGDALLFKYPRLEAWVARMEQRDEARHTYDGTVASQRPAARRPAKF
jgi:glutathione S-transferase